MPTFAVGKITDIFCGRGIADSTHTGNNREGIEETLRLVREAERGLVFVNLVDTDMLYGHRNDAEGYARALEYLDGICLLSKGGMRGDDILS